MANKITKLNLLGTDFDILSNIPNYTTNEHYPQNSVIVKDGSIFRAKVNIPAAPATWQASQWDQIGGADAIIIEMNSSSSTWTSTTPWAKITENLGKSLVLIKFVNSAYYFSPWAIKYESSKITAYVSVSSSTLTMAHYYNYEQSGSYTESTIYNASGNYQGYSTRTVGTLTVEDGEGTTLGTFNGSANQTITLPDSFDILTTAEIDDIWENA